MNKQYKCPKCYSENYKIILHEEKHPVAKILQCNKCNYIFNKWDGIDAKINFKYKNNNKIKKGA